MHSLQLFVIGIIILPLLIDGLPFFHRGRPRGGMVGSPKRTFQIFILSTKSPSDELWYTQQLDHFNPADARTWQQRYFVNDAHWKKNGPVFIQIGGEGPADPIWMTEGQWINMHKHMEQFVLWLNIAFMEKVIQQSILYEID